MSEHYLKGMDTYGGNGHLQMVARESGFTAGAGFSLPHQTIAGFVLKTIAQYEDKLLELRQQQLQSENALVAVLERLACLEKAAAKPMPAIAHTPPPQAATFVPAKAKVGK